MKKLIILLSSFLLSAHFVLAQAPPPDWTTFVSKSEDFSIETPVSLKVSENDFKDNRSYWGSGDGLYLYVFADKAESIGIDSGAKALKYATEHQKSAGSATIDGKEAQEYAFEDEDGFHHRIASLKSKGVRYVFQTVSSEKSNPAADRFFSSIRLNKSVQKDKTVPEPDSNTVAIEKTPNASGIVYGTGSGSGVGYGRGSGTGSGSASGSTPSQGTTNVKILSKPRASYTDYARLYNISGSINLRITFLADGTIGDVVPVTKLPFGLVGNAVSAARSMRFEPARKDGVPYSKTLTVQYGFVIY